MSNQQKDPSASRRLHPEEVLATVDAERESGELAAKIRAGSDVVYQASQAGSGRVVALYRDGSRVEGTFLDGRFTPDETLPPGK